MTAVRLDGTLQLNDKTACPGSIAVRVVVPLNPNDSIRLAVLEKSDQETLLRLAHSCKVSSDWRVSDTRGSIHYAIGTSSFTLSLNRKKNWQVQCQIYDVTDGSFLFREPVSILTSESLSAQLAKILFHAHHGLSTEETTSFAKALVDAPVSDKYQDSGFTLSLSTHFAPSHGLVSAPAAAQDSSEVKHVETKATAATAAGAATSALADPLPTHWTVKLMGQTYHLDQLSNGSIICYHDETREHVKAPFQRSRCKTQPVTQEVVEEYFFPSRTQPYTSKGAVLNWQPSVSKAPNMNLWTIKLRADLFETIVKTKRGVLVGLDEKMRVLPTDVKPDDCLSNPSAFSRKDTFIQDAKGRRIFVSVYYDADYTDRVSALSKQLFGHTGLTMGGALVVMPRAPSRHQKD